MSIGGEKAAFADDAKERFSISEQPIDTALLEFAQQAQVSILFPGGVFADINANQLEGEYSLREALDVLLKGTGIEVSIVNEAQQIVVRVMDINNDNTHNNEGETEMLDKPRGARGLLASAIAALMAGGSGSAAYSQAPQTPLEEITVTGSRIRQTDGMATPTPITAVTPSELSNFEPGGTIAEQLDALPQFFATQTAQRGGAALFGTAGGSYLDMRGLGAQRTLVLLDGARVMPADKRGSVNIDTFPTALVRSVDVVTGGASAAYGADALGGVTNFVLDREFQGLKIETGSGITEEGDGARWNFSIAGGKQVTERLNLIGSLEARHINQIWRNPEDLDSDWYQRWGHVTNPAWKPTDPPGTNPQRLTLPWVTSSEHGPTGVIWARNGSSSNSPLRPFALNGMTFTDDGKAVRPFVHGDIYSAPEAAGGTQSMSGGPEAQRHNAAFDGGPAGAEVVGRSGFAAAQYEFSDALTGFAQVMAGRSESNTTDRRGWNSLQNRWYATVYRENAFLPPEVGAAMDTAGITSFQLHKLGSFLGKTDEGVGTDNRGVFGTYSWNVGIDAKLPRGWDMRASWQSGESHKRTGTFGGIRMDRVYMAIDAVRDPATGAIVCNVQRYNPTPAQLAESVAGRTSEDGSPLQSPVGLDNSIRDCVPYDVMGAGNMSKEAQRYVSTPKMGESRVNQDFAELLLTGQLFEGWSGPVSMAAGLTYREQSFSEIALPVDIDKLGPPLNAPNLGIRGVPIGYSDGSPNLHRTSTIPNVSGSYDVWEWFSEVNVPVWESGSGEQRLDGSIAYRSSDYSSIGRIESWKLGLEFQLIEDLRFRTTKSRDVREATFSERFDAQGGGGTVNDPRFNNASFQITTVSGGNPNLRPEVADTIVAGVVYQPAWAEGLQVSTDWYRVDISDAVSSLGVQRIMNECEINKVTALCAQIERNPDSGNVARIFNVFLNVAQAKVEGIDLETSYRFEPDFFSDSAESFNFRALAGYIIERSDTPLGGVPFDVAGDIDTPDLTANLTGTYNIGPYGIQLQQRYTAETLLDVNWVEGVDVDDNSVSSGNYTNLRLNYEGEMASGSTWDVALNVTNLFDRNPPIVPSFNARGGSQIVPNGYDTYGRRYQLSLNMNF